MSEPPVQHHEPRHSGKVAATFRRLMRARVTTGVLIVIPIYVTFIVVRVVFNLMRRFTEPLARWLVDFWVEAGGEKFKEAERFLNWSVPAVAVLLTLFILYLLGLFAANVFGRRIIRFLEALLDRLPIVKTVYRSTQQVLHAFALPNRPGLQRVVLIPFPAAHMRCIGFLTAELTDTNTGRKLCAVFIPTTPNPTTGYMQIVPAEQVTETGWTVEQGIKTVMSGGVLSPPTVPFEFGMFPQATQNGRETPAEVAAVAAVRG